MTEWTRETPTKPGWYWWASDARPDRRRIVRVEIPTKDDSGYVNFIGLAGLVEMGNMSPGSWVGPLIVPEPPKSQP